MTTKISSNNLDTTVLALLSPRITGIAIADATYTVLDDTAVNTAGGYIVITGVNFVTGCSVIIGSLVATSVSFINSTTVRAQIPAQAAGSYTVYLVNPDGSVAIRVNGLNYSATPTWSTTSPLTSGVVNTAVSIQLSATSNSAVTYALQAGSSLPAGLTLSSGGLLSGTVTGISVDTTYNFTVVATDTELQDTPQAFSITISVGDTNFQLVSTLLSANTPASTFVSDASTNSFNVTVVGDARPSNFGPYTPGYYSNSFDGTGDYLTAASNTAFYLSSGDFTIEAWIYKRTTGKQIIVGQTQNNSAPYAGWLVYIGATELLTFEGTNGSVIGSTSVTVPRNTWTHIAVVKSGSTVTLYQNGVSVNSGTAPSITDFATVLAIGSYSSYTAGAEWNGFISNLRIVKGTAVYTAAFTPSTVPLTAITNTSILTCQSNRFIDTSSNAFALTVNGDTTISGFDPFVPSTSFAGRGSGYFDGTGDYLSVPTNAAFSFGTGDFTIEGWAYLSSNTGAYRVIAYIPHSSGQIVVRFGSSADYNSLFQVSILTTAASNVYSCNQSQAVLVNQWVHFAFTRSSGVCRLFLNGTLQSLGTGTNPSTFPSTSFSDSTNITNNAAVGIGEFIGQTTPWIGYISNLRALKGTALYTTNFTPPATPLTAIANTSLLTLQNNQPTNNNMFLDASTNNFNVTRNGNTTQGTFSPYGGGWSNYTAGSSSGGSKIDVAGTSGVFGTNVSYTMEAWVNFPAVTSGDHQNIIATGNNSFPNRWLWDVAVTSSTIQLRLVTESNSINFSSTATAYTLGTWAHIAIVNNNAANTCTFYLNGVSIGSTTKVSLTAYSTLNLLCNSSSAGAVPFYISNFRIVNNAAVYTANFTPSTTPLTPIAGTELLIFQDNRFVDKGGSARALTVNGTNQIQRFNPFGSLTNIPTTYSVFLDGTGDYLTITSSSIIPSSQSTFTIEGWIYMTANPSVYNGTVPAMFGDISGGANFLSMGPVGTGPYYAGFYWYDGAGKNVRGDTTLSLNTWYHLAVSVASNTIRLFVNGVLQTLTGTATLTNRSGTSGAYSIGYYNAPSTVTGYVSNLRVVNGTAVYTATFTPATTPLTAITNTTLLTCQDNTIIDNSVNNFTIAASGDTVARQFNPFGWNTSRSSYAPAVYGGSAYFDGTGDFLTATHPGMSGTWTIELWWYATSVTTQQSIISFNDGSFSGINIWCNTSSQLVVDDGNTGQTAFSGTTFRAGQWNHMAVVRNGSTTTGYINGILAGSHSFTPATVGFINIGRYNSSPFYYVTGYVSDVRTVIGQALYTSNFAPPVAPLTARQNTVFLASMTGAGIYDSAGQVDLETVGSARINTTIKKYGNSSMLFNGTDSGLSIRGIPTYGIGGADFTIEFWMYPTANNGAIFTTGTNGSTLYWYVLFNSSNQIVVYTSNDTTWNAGWVNTYTSTSTVTLNTWTHIAIVRNGASSFNIYFNGVSGYSSASFTCVAGFSGTLFIGNYYMTGQYFNGYIADLRITRGVARYTTTFTPTATPFLQQ